MRSIGLPCALPLARHQLQHSETGPWFSLHSHGSSLCLRVLLLFGSASSEFPCDSRPKHAPTQPRTLLNKADQLASEWQHKPAGMGNALTNHQPRSFLIEAGGAHVITEIELLHEEGNAVFGRLERTQSKAVEVKKYRKGQQRQAQEHIRAIQATCAMAMPGEMSSLSFGPTMSEVSSADRSSGRLSLSLEPELLRAVPLSVALDGWGRHWRLAAPDSHRFSKPVTSMDYFLSHDWQTSGWLKFAALLIHFNSTAAALTSLCVSLLVGVLRVMGILPDHFWTICFPYLAFLVVFRWWQTLRLLLLGPLNVFMDRLCIDQNDQDKKKPAILGLGAFVLRSQQLVILWSPRYFRRLWCTYEVGCFVKSNARMEIVSVHMAALLLLSSLLWHALLLCYYSITAGRAGADHASFPSFADVFVSVELQPAGCFFSLWQFPCPSQV